jgi:membrane glycosyltransferase
MSLASAPEGAGEAAAADPTSLTPAGIEPRAPLTRRRMIFFALNAATYGALLLWLGAILGAGGWSGIDTAIFVCFAFAAPWSVLGVWNALLGLWILHGGPRARASIAAFTQVAARDEPLRHRTAILLTLRNEDTQRAFRRLDIVKRSLDQTGVGAQFDFFVLSDTNDPAVAAQEEAAVANWRAAYAQDAERLFYRRRAENTGFKAGNLRDFCERWGEAYEFMVPLDADSLMSGETIVRLVRIAQHWPKLGLLQSLVVGAPAQSAFARIFQFGMRHGMRPYTMGSVWWIGDCGPFWGHNALVRVAPFLKHCELPVLPGGPPLGGAILSHDQIEAALMRRGGYETRVLAEECGSYEDNPPTLIDFTRRDLRWCHGNLQYPWLIGMKGLLPTSRFHLIWAVAMFAGLPAWTAIIALAALKPFDGEDPGLLPVASALAFYGVFLLMYLAPKLAGFIDIGLTPGGLKRYGGAARFYVGALIEILFSFLLSAATTFRTSLYMIGLAFGRSVTWIAQDRDARSVSFMSALAGLWPQLIFGLAVNGLFFYWSPWLLLAAAPLTWGYALAIPFAMLTASPAVGRLLVKARLCASPEEFDAPPEIAALAGG